MYTCPPNLFVKAGLAKYKPVTAEILASDPNTVLYFKDTTAEGALIYNEETPTMRKKRQQVVQLLADNIKLLRRVEATMVEYVQEYRAEYPPIYFAVLADARGSDSSYLTAKTLVPMIDGKNKEIRIYLGLDKEFPDYKNNPKVHRLAEEKMKATLRNKLENGEFEPKGE
ncbi:MAG: hypothetical protein EON98_00340 [Chitinophagaceae bacterium]|nr:MAG: hypothetical protein EON98_00340 [Chitinophagaceae bacterium]